MFEREFLCNTLRTSQVRHYDYRATFFKDFLQSRDGSPDTGIIRDLELFIKWNIEIHPYDGFFA